MANPVLEQLSGIGNTLYQGQSNLGDVKLKGAFLKEDIRRNRLMEAPMQLASQQAQGQLDKRQRPVTIHTFSQGDAWSMNHAVHYMDEVANYFDADYVTLEDAQKDAKLKPFVGQILKKDGNIITEADIQDNSQQVAGIILSKTDPVESIKDHKDRLEYTLSNGLVSNPKQVQALQAELAKADEILNSSDEQIKFYEKHMTTLMSLKGPGFEKGANYLQGKITALQAGKIATQKTKTEFMKIALTALVDPKDTRSSDEKWADYVSKHTGMKKAEAARLIMDNDVLSSLTRAFSEWWDAQPIDVKMSPDADKIAQNKLDQLGIFDILTRSKEVWAGDEPTEKSWMKYDIPTETGVMHTPGKAVKIR